MNACFLAPHCSLKLTSSEMKAQGSEGIGQGSGGGAKLWKAAVGRGRRS